MADQSEITPRRLTVPARCRKQAIEYHPNGYRTCAEHAEPGGAPCMDDDAGPCDYPMDGLGAARLEPHRPSIAEVQALAAAKTIARETGQAEPRFVGQRDTPPAERWGARGYGPNRG